MSRAARIAARGRRLLPPADIRPLAVIQLIDAIGSGVFISGSAIIYVRAFGFSPGTIAVGIGAAGVTGLLASMFSGRFVDLAGHRRSLACLTAAQAVAYLGFFLVDTFAIFALLLCLIAAIDYAKGTAFTAVLADILHGQPSAVRSRAVIRSFFNAGFFGGSSAAGLLLGVGPDWLLIVFVGCNSVSYLVCLGLVLRLRHSEPAGPARARRRFEALRDRQFFVVVLLSSLLGIHGAILTVALPLWILGHTAISSSLIPFLIALNTVLAVTIQIPAARNADRIPGSARAARQSSYLVAAGCLLVAATGAVDPLAGSAVAVVAVAVLSLGEFRQAASRWGLSFALAPVDARAEYLGAFNVSLALSAVYCTPLAVLLTSVLGASGWFVLAALLLVSGAAVAPAARRAGRAGVASGRLDAEVMA